MIVVQDSIHKEKKNNLHFVCRSSEWILQWFWGSPVLVEGNKEDAVEVGLSE